MCFFRLPTDENKKHFLFEKQQICIQIKFWILSKAVLSYKEIAEEII